jgi:hypothetical protein
MNFFAGDVGILLVFICNGLSVVGGSAVLQVKSPNNTITPYTMTVPVVNYTDPNTGITYIAGTYLTYTTVGSDFSVAGQFILQPIVTTSGGQQRSGSQSIANVSASL